MFPADGITTGERLKGRCPTERRGGEIWANVRQFSKQPRRGELVTFDFMKRERRAVPFTDE